MNGDGVIQDLPFPSFRVPDEEAEETLSPDSEHEYEQSKSLLRALLTIPKDEDHKFYQDSQPTALDYIDTYFPKVSSYKGDEMIKVALPAILQSLKSTLSPVVSAARLAGKGLYGAGKIVAKPIMHDPTMALFTAEPLMEHVKDFQHEGLAPRGFNWGKE